MSKTSSGFSKVWKLISVLQKCNGSGVIGSKDALISPMVAKVLAAIGLVLLTGAIGLAAFFTEPLVAQAVSVTDVTKSLMLIMLLLSFILSVKNVVTVLYTSDDISALMPLPFSANQIVAAKLAVTLRFPLGLSLIVINSVCIGFGLRAGMGAAFLIGAVLASVLIPVTGLAVSTLLVVVVFRVFGFIRNRDIMVAIGGLFTLAITIAYIIISNTLNKNGSSGATAALSAFATVSDGFPNIAFMSRFMAEGNVLWLLLSIAVTLAVTALAALAVKLFYLSTALAMQSTGTGKRAVSKGELSGGKNAGAGKTLFSYESKNTRRNPAYLVYGFAMTFIWPVLFILPFLLGKQLNLDMLELPLGTSPALLIAVLIGVMSACFACGFNVLAVTAFSREGSSFDMLKTMPVDFKDYYKSKRNYSMLICSLGSVLYIVILGVVCLIMGTIALESCWVIPVGALAAFMTNLILINAMLLKNAKKPRFNWDSETELSRKLSWINIVAVVIGVILLMAFMIVLMFSSSLNRSGAFPMTVGFVITAIVLIVGWAVNHFAVKKGEKLLRAID